MHADSLGGLRKEGGVCEWAVEVPQPRGAGGGTCGAELTSDRPRLTRCRWWILAAVQPHVVRVLTRRRTQDSGRAAGAQRGGCAPRAYSMKVCCVCCARVSIDLARDGARRILVLDASVRKV